MREPGYDDYHRIIFPRERQIAVMITLAGVLAGMIIFSVVWFA
jgi:hypothetical protein